MRIVEIKNTLEKVKEKSTQKIGQHLLSFLSLEQFFKRKQ
jgi:hypothetical protein